MAKGAVCGDCTIHELVVDMVDTSGDWSVRKSIGFQSEEQYQQYKSAAKTRGLTVRLHENGVTLKVKRDDKTREILGVSYGFEGLAYRGYRLGSQYTYQGIQKHLGVRMVVDSLPKDEEIELDGVGQVEPVNSFMPVVIAFGASEAIDEPVVQPKAKKVVDMER